MVLIEPVFSNKDSFGWLKISGSICDPLETLNQKFQTTICKIWGKSGTILKRNSNFSIGRRVKIQKPLNFSFYPLQTLPFTPKT